MFTRNGDISKLAKHRILDLKAYNLAQVKSLYLLNSWLKTYLYLPNSLLVVFYASL